VASLCVVLPKHLMVIIARFVSFFLIGAQSICPDALQPQGLLYDPGNPPLF